MKMTEDQLVNWVFSIAIGILFGGVAALALVAYLKEPLK